MMKMKLLLMLLAIGQVQAELINVPGGDFQMYKPGTGYTVTATFPGAGEFDNYAQQVGDGLPVLGAGVADYSDSTTGSVVDLPGWSIIQGNNDVAHNGVDGSTGLNVFASWGGDCRRETTGDLGNIGGGASYTITAMINGGVSDGPLAFYLSAGGVELPPSSSVEPVTPVTNWQQISRTYDAEDITAYIGEPITIVIGVRDENDIGGRMIWDNISLSYRIPAPPSQATNPKPSNGATDVWPDSNLSWIAGDGSKSSDVYFGTNLTPDSSEFQGNQVETFFKLDTMDENTTYYWRIDAVNTEGTTPGEVWSFTTVADSSMCPPELVLPPVTGCDGLVLTDPSSIDTQSAGIITNTGGGIGGADSTTVNDGAFIDILDSGCFQLGKDGNDFALSFWLKATGATQIIGTKTQYNGDQGFLVFVDGNSELCATSSEGSGNTTVSSTPIPLNEWNHVVINYVNGDNSTFEVNINLAPTSGFAYENVYNSNLRIGDEGWGAISSFDVCIFQSWGRVLSRNEIKALYFDKAPDLGLSSAILSSVMSEIMDHLTGTTPLTGPQIETLTETFVANGRFLDEDTAVMTEAFDLIDYYETTEGPLFINAETAGGFPRVQGGSDGYELERAIFTIQQEIHDRIFDAENCQSCQPFFDGKVFETSDFFPGACVDPINPETVYEVDINASNPEMWGRPVCYGPIPARRPTGLYLAPGSIGEVTVPTAMVNQGFGILVGAHAVDKFKYYKDTLRRLDRVSKSFPITSTVTSIANPLGGGVYIMVPYEADLGSQTVQIANVVQAPFFSATSTKQTTLQEWTDTERYHPGPWADFETDVFMMSVPTSWIYNYADPISQMDDWDVAMDAVSELIGYAPPNNVRNISTLYVQVDTDIQHGAYGTGYPQINHGYNPNDSTNGNSSHFFLTDVLGWSTEFHELCHCQLFSKFPGHEESMVNLPYIYVATEYFGMPLVEAFTDSMQLAYLENIDVDQAALTWFVTENFRNGNPMDITYTEYNEVRYQHRGYGRYVEIGTLFGWEVLKDFYYQEQLDYIAGTPSDGLDEVDSRIFRLSKAAGVDLTPLIHCWGVHPVNLGALQAAIAAEGLPMSQAFYDRLVHYKDIIPADNAEFWDHYTTIYPTEPEGGNPLYQYGWYNVWKYIYDTPEGTAAKAAMQDIIDLYYPEIPEIEFADDPVVKADAAEGSPYNESLALDVTVPGDKTVTFEKIGGPSWLNVDTDGTLTGVAGHADIGLNNFVIRAKSELGITFVVSDGSVQITVLDTFTGELGMPDFAGFAGHWLDSGCVDVPACGGADLTGDQAVGIDDLRRFGLMWLE